MKDKICKYMEKIAKEAKKRGYERFSGCVNTADDYCNWFISGENSFDMTKLNAKSEWQKMDFNKLKVSL